MSMELRTKYNIGDICWMMYDNHPIQVEINSCTVEVSNEGKKGGLYVGIKYAAFRGKDLMGIVPQYELYRDKEELKNALFCDYEYPLY